MPVKLDGMSNFRPSRPQELRPEAIVIHIIDGSFAASK